MDTNLTRTLNLHIQTIPAHGPVGRTRRMILPVQFTPGDVRGDDVWVQVAGTKVIVPASHLTEANGISFEVTLLIDNLKAGDVATIHDFNGMTIEDVNDALSHRGLEISYPIAPLGQDIIMWHVVQK